MYLTLVYILNILSLLFIIVWKWIIIKQIKTQMKSAFHDIINLYALNDVSI